MVAWPAQASPHIRCRVQRSEAIMPTMALPVWDGTRERSPRTMLSNVTTSAQGIEFRFVSEQITTPTDWCFEEAHHVVVVHRGGRLHSMEIEFDRGPSGPHIPRVGG